MYGTTHAVCNAVVLRLGMRLPGGPRGLRPAVRNNGQNRNPPQVPGRLFCYTTVLCARYAMSGTAAALCPTRACCTARAHRTTSSVGPDRVYGTMCVVVRRIWY
eukprot:2577941-Rhodomonas_salina.1